MKNIQLDTFLDFKYIGNLKTSNNHQSIAFVVAKAHYEKNEYHHDLYVGTKNAYKKVLSMKKNQAFSFLNSQQLLIDLQKTKKEEKDLKENNIQSYYRYDVLDKTLTKAFDLPFKALIEEVIHENTLLISTALKEKDHILYEGSDDERKAHLKTSKQEAIYEDIDTLPYLFNGADFTHDLKKQLFLYDLTRGVLTRVTDKSFHIENFALSSDKQSIYYTGKMPEPVKTFYNQIYRYDIPTQKHHVIYDGLTHQVVKLIPFEKTLVVAAKDMKTYGMNQNPDFFIVKDQKLECLKAYGQTLGNTIGTDCRLLKTESSFVKNDVFYFVATNDTHSEILTLNLKGEITSIYPFKGSIDGLVDYEEDMLLIDMKDQNLQEMYTLSHNDQRLKRISRFNLGVLKDRYIAKPKVVVVKEKTHDVKGFVLLPKDYDENKSYPAILNIHGGPKTVYGSIYYHEMQYWANEGYVVFFANPRGSDGKGDAFADIRGKYGTIDFDDLIQFTQTVLKKYKAIDEDRLYVTGGSYGGFMTNWLVGHTDMFKAAVTQRSISNWLSFYGTSDIGYYFAKDQTAGDPIHDFDKLYQQSPIAYALNIKTPLLFIHSDKDHRCPIEQAQQLYAILKYQGVETKLVWIKNENHELSRSGKPQARVKRLTEITAWFQSH